MKKLFLTLLLLCSSILFVNATPDKILIRSSQHPTSAGPRTPEPSINAYIEDGVLTVSIDRYLGYVSTTIEDANGTEADSDIEYINGASTYVMNVSALTPGTYTVYFMFSDGREYYGIFTVE